MLNRITATVFLLCYLLVTPITAQEVTPITAQETDKIARVFLLVGQSNMQGHAVVSLDDPKDYNGGKGTLVQVMKKKANQRVMKHLTDADGNWAVRDDVFCWYRTPNELKTGGLSVGFSAYPGEPQHFGPELQFGHVVGDAFEEPVILIKTAWGGKSLYKDFRSPAAGGDVGRSYVKMLEQIGEAMEDAEKEMPSLKDHQLVISGLVWQQGWNDMIDDEATAQYEQNMLHFISDIRKQIGVLDLPVVIGELGNGGQKEVSQQMKAFRGAQAAVAKHGDRNVAFVETASFARPAKQSPNVGHLHHWYGNAESYFHVGDALGRQMVDLVKSKGKSRVLILGDSISIGYTPFVKKALEDSVFVTRPMRGNRAENCAGTDSGIKNIDRWLTLSGGNWDVIHFNFGLHDLKHVDGKTGQNSNKAEDPLQSSPEEYERQMRAIVAKLKATGAKLVFCTTTPVPEGCKPLRETTSPGVYNEIAVRIAKENGIAVNDLYTFANSRLEEIQRPANVHFTAKGSELFAGEVTKAIRSALNDK